MLTITSTALAAAPFRPPAIPLVTHSPYFSIWQMSDRLTDEWPKHWTGAAHALCGMIRVDGKAYRFLGAKFDGEDVPAMEQTSLQVTPTRTIATFKAPGVELEVTFCSPLLPDDLNVLARPITYLDLEVRSIDGKPHDVNAYVDACAEIAVHTTDQVVTSGTATASCEMLTTGVAAPQPTLGRKGDSVRIDWGHFYLATNASSAARLAGAATKHRTSFARNGAAEPGDVKLDLAPRPVKTDWPVIGFAVDLGTVTSDEQCHFILAYDEDKSIEYLRTPLDPYWKRQGHITRVIGDAMNHLGAIENRCREFDEKLMTDLTKVGGEKYAQLCALAYRQAIAGHGLAASPDDRPFMFSKENSSNGCIGTVDVIYPTAPLFLLLSPALMEANLAPVIEYAASPRWKFDFAPHDLGTYPLANGQVYGGGEKTEENQMPVEESANMLILVAALEKATAEPSKLAKKHLPLLEKWANYLLEKGLDPENQLCTDDFTGHLAHNVNLSAKAIIGIAAFGQICENHGQGETGKRYRTAAGDMAAKWMKMAYVEDHTKLAFDKAGTWSQKYNLVWDKVLGLGLFPPKLLQREVDYYKSKSNKYGPPLDNRAAFAKLDWTAWSACLSDKPADFAALIDPLYDFAHETPDRVPLTDWYFTDTAKQQHFRARPVVGGLFMKMLCDDAVWRKWARQSNE